MFELTNFAYAAGYTDGDGCFHIGKVHTENRIRHRALFVINSTEIENVQWFQKVFGGSITSKKRRKSNHKIIYRYVLKGKGIEKFKYIGSFLHEKIWEFCIFNQFQDPILRDKIDEMIREMKIVKTSANLVSQEDIEKFRSIKNSISPNENDFAYLAGFIDAECCLNIQKSHPKNRPNPTYKIQLQCNNTKSPSLRWIAQRFGGQFHFIDRSKYRNNRNQITWRLSSAALYPVLKGILPFLNHKKPVCEEMIKFYETKVPLENTISRNSPDFSDFYRPILEEREAIFHKIQSLNKKGV